MRRLFKIPPLLAIPLGIYAAGLLLLIFWHTISASRGSDPYPTNPASSSYVVNKSSSGPLPLLIGKPAPDFTLTGLDGTTHRLQDYIGKQVILNFWATWCAPCRLEMPLLQRTYARLQTNGLVIIGVDQAENATTVSNFVKELNVTFPILFDDRNLSVTQTYGVIGLPTTFFIDTKGIVQAKQIGMVTDETLPLYLDQFAVWDGSTPTLPR